MIKISNLSYSWLIIIVIFLHGCCSTNRIVDDNGIPERTKLVRITTPFQNNDLRKELSKILNSIKLSFTEKENVLTTSPLIIKGKNNFVRFKIAVHNSSFTIYPEVSNNQTRWKRVVNCGEIGNQSYEKLTIFVSRLQTLSIQFNLKKIFGLKCLCMSK